MNLILASNSPRRKEILNKFGYDFTVKASNFSETNAQGDPILVATGFAKGKASDVFFSESRLNIGADFVVLGADTVVYFDGKIIGKPKDKADAYKTLEMLSGNVHFVVTGFSVLSKNTRVLGYDVSEVVFNDLSEKTIAEYIATGKPLDKAGSYGIQDGFNLVRTVKGSVNNVIGLPIEKVKFILDGLLFNKK